MIPASDLFLVEWLLNAALASRDSPLSPWRMEHAFTEACRERRCLGESCARREAICTFEAWAGRVMRGEPEPCDYCGACDHEACR